MWNPPPTSHTRRQTQAPPPQLQCPLRTRMRDPEAPSKRPLTFVLLQHGRGAEVHVPVSSSAVRMADRSPVSGEEETPPHTVQSTQQPQPASLPGPPAENQACAGAAAVVMANCGSREVSLPQTPARKRVTPRPHSSALRVRKHYTPSTPNQNTEKRKP